MGRAHHTGAASEQQSQLLSAVDRQAHARGWCHAQIQGRLEVTELRQRPGLILIGADATVAGVIHGVDRLTLHRQHLPGGAADRPPHGGPRLAWIAVHLALGVGAEVVAVHGEAVAVAQRPGARQHGLGGERGRR